MPKQRAHDRAVATLADAGDLTAPPGSQRWAIAVRMRIQNKLSDYDSNASRLKRLIADMAQHEGYKELYDPSGQPFTSWRAFCLARLPFGLGYDPDALDAVVKERMTAQERAKEPKELHQHGEVGNGRVCVTNSTPVSKSIDADYLTARIARDRPDILERMKAGEYTSVRQAALDAGIVKPRLSVPATLEGAERAIRRQFTSAEIQQLIDRLQRDDS